MGKFEQFLQNANQSATAPRLALFQYLQANDPTTTHAVINAPKLRCDRATLYRTLNLFRRLGIIHDSVIGGKRMIELSDLFDTHHHHFSCISCGKVSSIEDDGLEEALNKVSDGLGIKLLTHQVDITGICSNCA